MKTTNSEMPLSGAPRRSQTALPIAAVTALLFLLSGCGGGGAGGAVNLGSNGTPNVNVPVGRGTGIAKITIQWPAPPTGSQGRVIPGNADKIRFTFKSSDGSNLNVVGTGSNIYEVERSAGPTQTVNIPLPVADNIQATVTALLGNVALASVIKSGISIEEDKPTSVEFTLKSLVTSLVLKGAGTSATVDKGATLPITVAGAPGDIPLAARTVTLTPAATPNPYFTVVGTTGITGLMSTATGGKDFPVTLNASFLEGTDPPITTDFFISVKPVVTLSRTSHTDGSSYEQGETITADAVVDGANTGADDSKVDFKLADPGGTALSSVQKATSFSFTIGKTGSAAQDYTLNAVAVDGSGATAAPIKVTVQGLAVAFTSLPPGNQIKQGTGFSFVAAATGAVDKGVTYALSGGGTLNPATGAYTAPGAAEDVIITAKSKFDPTITASVTIKVIP